MGQDDRGGDDLPPERCLAGGGRGKASEVGEQLVFADRHEMDCVADFDEVAAWGSDCSGVHGGRGWNTSGGDGTRSAGTEEPDRPVHAAAAGFRVAVASDLRSIDRRGMDALGLSAHGSSSSSVWRVEENHKDTKGAKIKKVFVLFVVKEVLVTLFL